MSEDHKSEENYICKEISSLAVDHLQDGEQETKVLEEWLDTIAEPNIIEIDKKTFELRNKWQSFI